MYEITIVDPEQNYIEIAIDDIKCYGIQFITILKSSRETLRFFVNHPEFKQLPPNIYYNMLDESYDVHIRSNCVLHYKFPNKQILNDFLEKFETFLMKFCEKE